METKAILKVTGRLENLFADLYLTEEDWKNLVGFLKRNKLTVVLRMMHEYVGDLRVEDNG